MKGEQWESHGDPIQAYSNLDTLKRGLEHTSPSSKTTTSLQTHVEIADMRCDHSQFSSPQSIKHPYSDMIFSPFDHDQDSPEDNTSSNTSDTGTCADSNGYIGSFVDCCDRDSCSTCRHASQSIEFTEGLNNNEKLVFRSADRGFECSRSMSENSSSGGTDRTDDTRESDRSRIEARLKQIQFGKSTIGYYNYSESVPRNKRAGYSVHPRTPDAYERMSKRCFDGKIRAWRRALHKWDTGGSYYATAFCDKATGIELRANFCRQQTPTNSFEEYG